MALGPRGTTFLTLRLRRRMLLGLGVSGLAVALVLLLRPTPPLRVAEAKSYDLRTEWLAEPAAADSGIVVLAIDENSLDVYGDSLGRWPWDRDVYDALITYVAVGGARAVVFDITFPEPDRNYPLGDTVLAASLSDAGIGVLAFSLDPGDSAEAVAWERSRAAERGPARTAALEALLKRSAIASARDADREATLNAFPYAEPPYELIGGAAAGLGVLNWSPDADGVTREQLLLFEHQGRLYPSLPLAAARLVDPERFGGSPEVVHGAVRFGDTSIPLDHGRLIVRWHGPYMRNSATTYRVIPAFHVLDSFQAVRTGREPTVPLDAFKGKIVFIAATAVGAFDTRATPLSSHDPGVIIHATLLDNLLHGDFIRRAGWPANAAVVALSALLAAGAVVGFDSALAGTMGALLVLLLAGGVATLALSRGVWLDMAAPLFAGSLAFAGAMVGNYLTEGREKRRVRELFGRYVSPEYVSRLADEYENVKLGGERIPVTLLFSDIRGFTTLSEKLEAETVIRILNEYLERMAEVVFRHGGTLDKFIGDAVMAFWNAPVPTPDHAQRAVETALDMLTELEALNERWAATGAAAQLRIGIGINTGEAIVGNIGSLTRKLDYTAIGDTVNLASRLEGQNKEYGTSIIVSEFTRAALPEDAYELHALDEVKVKGKEKAVKIYELRGRRGARTPRSSGVATATLAGLLLALAAVPLAGQQSAQARWTDWVYRPGAWQGARVAPYVTRDPSTDSLALVSRVDVYSMAPRWRAEFQEVISPDSVTEPLVVVGDGDQAVVLTALGSTPLSDHAAAQDPLVRAVLARLSAGKPTPTPPARVVDRAANGTVLLVILRKPAARAEFDEALLKTGSVGRLGRSLARLGIHAVGGERKQEVVASAGARGVATVKTPGGEITVMPDTAGILRIERVDVGLIDVDRFLREAGVEPVPAPADAAKHEEDR